MEIIELPVEQVKPAPWNPNEMEMSMQARLRHSIEEFDLVAVGRALIANPAWAHIVQRNAMHELKPYGPASLSPLY